MRRLKKLGEGKMAKGSIEDMRESSLNSLRVSMPNQHNHILLNPSEHCNANIILQFNLVGIGAAL